MNDLILEDDDGFLNVMYIASSFNIRMGVSYILVASAYEGRTSSEDMVKCVKVKMRRMRDSKLVSLCNIVSQLVGHSI
jgi:hypothetical protein